MSEIQPQKSKAAEREEEILAFWGKDDTFHKSLEKKAPKGDFIFYDGPPFATGLPHYGHILASTIKDVIPRFKTMQGYRVPRRWGWDCHGLPVENEVEKELGFKTKKDIEAYGIEKFNAAAKKTVMRYADDWRRIIPRLGRAVDMEDDYKTMDGSYTESVWWIFKTLYDKNLIYEGFKPMHLCPRCETTLSNFEVTQGYKELTDTSVYVKFALKDSANTYLIAWTTTPWTLPGNAALAVHPDLDYAFVEITASNAPSIAVGDTYVVGAKEEILRRVFGKESFTFDPASKVGGFTWGGAAVSFSAKQGIKGKKLTALSYTPPFNYYAQDLSLKNRDKGWRIYSAPFVTEEDGTGIVHIAPAFGEDDYNLAVQESLPFIQHISTDGTFKKEVTDFAGRPAKPKGNPRETDESIAALLEERRTLLAREPYVHDYPHCWRCDTPLLNFAAPSWFVRVSGMREKLTEENKKIAWVPKEVGEYRFGNWLAEAKDWAISRSRYWGAPIPVWRCERCGAGKAVGSLDELRFGSQGALTKLTFLRHGESEKNIKEIYDDLPDRYRLTRAGRRAAKEAAHAIETAGGVDVIYTSPVRRATETAQIIGAYLGKEVKVLEDLREVDSGEWDGKREDDPAVLAARRALAGTDPLSYYRTKRGVSGESWEAVEIRMKTAIQETLEKHKGESILFVSHEGPIVYALKAIDNLTLQDTEQFYKRDHIGGYAHPITVYVDSHTGKEFDLHRPSIDAVTLSCDVCMRTTGTGSGLMHRVSEVFDCWFESGSMPYGQAHYPFDFSSPRSFEPVGGWLKKSRGFPADFIAEGLDQTRGWFYSMLVLGTALFGRSPYRHVVVNGIILAENGQKMSKQLKNYPDPMELASKYGADSLRYYLLSSPAVRGEDLRFSERGVDEVSKKVFNRLDNVLQFYLLYAPSLQATSYKLQAVHILDQWIIARLNQLIAEVTGALENYELDKTARPIGDFVDDLSTWYLRRSRERIKSEVTEEKEAALGTLWHVLHELAKMLAPFAPFFAEYLYQQLTTNNLQPTTEEKRSVHLENWPSSSMAGSTSSVLQDMEEVRHIVSLGLEARAKANIKVRQPLGKLKVRSSKFEVHAELKRLIQEEINVKEIVIEPSIESEVELDTTLTPELREEGVLRELTRTVQDMRKRAGLTAGEFATLSIGASGTARRLVEKYQQELSRIASLKDIRLADSLPSGEAFSAEGIGLTLLLSKD